MLYTFFTRFGLKEDKFINKYYEQVKTDDGFIYEAEEACKKRTCPFCNYQFMNIHSYRAL